MIYLILSIIASSFLVLAFKYFEKYKIDNFHAAVVNYIVASTMGFLLNLDGIGIQEIYKQEWIFIAIILGVIFICMINIIALTTQRNGVSVATVATKTSLIIPVSLAVLLYGDQINIFKVAGIILALLSVFMVSKKVQTPNTTEDLRKEYLLPGILFITSGITDSLINFAQAKYVRPFDFGSFISTLFAVAASIGIIVVLYQVFVQHKKFQLKSIVGGVILGIINYGTLFFLMKTLENKSFESSAIFPVNNMGIVIFSAICALILFKEKISKTNWIGIFISILAIALIAFS